MLKDDSQVETIMAMHSHQPVMLAQALDLLNVRPGLVWVDATAGGGGHLAALLERCQDSTVIAIDRDTLSLAGLRERFAGEKRLQLAHADYGQLESILARAGLSTVNGGIIADLGVSSMQLDDPHRGFSFLNDGPLDMRMDPTQAVTAEQLVNTLSESELADIIFRYGEERHSRRIARQIIQCRPLHSTLQLASLVARCLPRSAHDRSHPATRTFQALRIAVNHELESLEKFLRTAVKVLAPQARLVVITFHSLEDRLVKQILRESAAACICPPKQPICTCHHRPELLIITRKPLVPGKEEVLANPRSRSAKLRAGEKLG